MDKLPNGDLIRDRAVAMAKRFYENVPGSWEDLPEHNQVFFIQAAIQILIDSPERKLLQQIKDYVDNLEMVGQFAQFGRGGAPMLAQAIRKSFVPNEET
jgi:hypothetical protein